jgi:hypothetical protein
MARGQWTHHTGDCQAELLGLLKAAGEPISVEELYRRNAAWGIRTATIKALIRKGLVKCTGKNIWTGKLEVVKGLVERRPAGL